jgi:hypothetical protein
MSVRRNKYMLQQEIDVEARKRHKDTYINDSKARVLIPAKVTIQVNGKRKKVRGYKIKVAGKIPRNEESMDRYKQRLNFDYTSKKHWGRFTKNPRAPRSLVNIEENPISNVHYKTTLIDQVTSRLLKK